MFGSAQSTRDKKETIITEGVVTTGQDRTVATVTEASCHCSHFIRRSNKMPETIAVVLLIVWLLGLVYSFILSIPLVVAALVTLLVVTVVMILLSDSQRRRIR
jgi:hypothetical protein